MENKSMGNKGIIFAAAAIVVVVVLMFVFFGGASKNKRIITEIDQLNDQIAVQYEKAEKNFYKKRSIVEERRIQGEKDYQESMQSMAELMDQKAEKIVTLKSIYSEEDCIKAHKEIEEIAIVVARSLYRTGGCHDAIKCGPIHEAFSPELKEAIENRFGKKLIDLKDPWGQPYMIQGRGGGYTNSNTNYDCGKKEFCIYSVDKNSKKGYVRCDPYETQANMAKPIPRYKFINRYVSDFLCDIYDSHYKPYNDLQSYRKYIED